MADIVEFKPAEKLRNEEVITILKQWMESAERGDLAAVAIAGVERDGTSVTGASSAQPFCALAGAVSILQHRMISRYIAE